MFMSGYSADVVDESFMLGAGLQFLQKPFTPSTLAKKIREVLEPVAPPSRCTGFRNRFRGNVIEGHFRGGKAILQGGG